MISYGAKNKMSIEKFELMMKGFILKKGMEEDIGTDMDKMRLKKGLIL